VKLLIDECLHTSLVELAHAAGHVADHVNYLGLGGLKDWEHGITRQTAHKRPRMPETQNLDMKKAAKIGG
jgi:predicted nuclease of predicted toxin-antitoxin system